MDILSRSFDEIAARAPGANRELVDLLHAQHAVIDAAGLTAISLGTLSDGDLVAVSEAKRRSRDAIDAAFSTILKRQYAAIAQLPEPVRERWTFSPMSAPSLLRAMLKSGEIEVTDRIRDHGDDIVVHSDGQRLGSVEAHGIRTTETSFVVEGVGVWPLDQIEAVSVDEGLAFLLDTGTLVVLQDAER